MLCNDEIDCHKLMKKELAVNEAKLIKGFKPILSCIIFYSIVDGNHAI